MKFSDITTLCFVGSYTVALALEAVSLLRRFGWHRLILIGFAVAGVFAHIAYLSVRASGTATPLSSPADWASVAALSLACVYLFFSFSAPRQAIGLFMLPLVLALLGVSSIASDKPISPTSASSFWGRTHGVLLVLATVTVIIGFLAGVMYLIQSWRLKHNLPPSNRLRLPSLETLQMFNARSLGFSMVLVAGGFASGLVLTRLRLSGQEGSIWADPLVISLTVMLAWLVAAELFRWFYPAARRGRKVAYLTVASFGFLLIVLASLLWTGSSHASAGVGLPQPTRQAI